MERVERNRDPMSGAAENRGETDRITKVARVDLVRRYLVAPNLWPDGIDWGNQWYVGNKKYWDALASEPGTAWEVVDREVRPRVDGANTVAEVEARIAELALRKPVTEINREFTEAVTETPSGLSVTVAEGPRRIGRPAKAGKVSVAERMRLYRERKRKGSG
jgi:hypothetical protein